MKPEFLYSATSMANFIKNDSIIDFLDILKKNNCTINPDLSINYEMQFSDTKKRKREEDDNTFQPTSSFNYIMENGHIFEKTIVEKIKENMTNSGEFHLFHNIKQSYPSKQLKETLNVLNSHKYTIITGAILHNKNNQTYGYPDLIVKGSWLKKYIKHLHQTIVPEIYYIIDIKSSTITLINGQTKISSSLLYDSYKMQVYIYTDALNTMINNGENMYGFILGKRYKYMQNRQYIYENEPMGHLGVIDFVEHNFKAICSDALDWKNYLKNNWKQISLFPIDTNILPNMKNSYDKCYHSIKHKIAVANKDITLLWNCGYKQRKLALENKIMCYDDKRLTPEIMGFNTTNSIYPILSKMLEMAKSDTDIVQLSNKNNHLNWREIMDDEIFVDFETFDSEDAFDELNDFNESLNVRNLYLIGVLKNNEYVCFLLNPPSMDYAKFPMNFPNNATIVLCETEKELLETFIFYVKNCNRLIHWSSAETIIFNKKVIEHNLNSANLPWYDMLTIFKNPENPIIIKDCFSFGLKDIVKKLNKHNFIDLKWDELDDGLLSAFLAKDIYKNNKKDDVMGKLINYNFIDCFALSEVLDWMRSYSPNPL